MQTWRLRQQRMGGNVVEIPQGETICRLGTAIPGVSKIGNRVPVSLLWAAKKKKKKTEFRTSRPHIKTDSPLEPE